MNAEGYWNDRAQRYAGDGAGLAAVCSYGMPGFYNRSIHLGQCLALRPWLADVGPGTRVLDVGCGVGRWSRRLARRGASVTGVDLSARMIAEAGRRAAREGLDGRCRFQTADVAGLRLGERFDLVLIVTVLQHLTDPAQFASAVRRLSEHVAPGGRLVALEAAPTRAHAGHNHSIFVARSEADYLRGFREAGLRCKQVTGVDPAPFKLRALRRYKDLPRIVADPLLAAATLLSLPVDLVAGRSWSGISWHKVFVLERAEDEGAGGGA